MGDPRFINTRFDPDLTPFHDLAKAMAKAFGYTADLSLNRELAQLLRLQVAQLNACAYCTILHAPAARTAGIAQARIDGLPAWRESGLYSAAEKAALAYGEALTRHATVDFPATHDALSAHFSPQEVAEIAAIIINMNVWTRLKLAQGAQPVPPEGAA